MASRSGYGDDIAIDTGKVATGTAYSNFPGPTSSPLGSTGPSINWKYDTVPPYGQTVTPAVADTRSLDYRDNPARPITRMWFGPMTMIDFLGNMNMSRYWWAGTSTEAPTWELKYGAQTAINSIRANNPNDFVSLVAFNIPTSTKTGVNGQWNTAISPLSQNYNLMKQRLAYAQYSITTGNQFSPFDSVAGYGPNTTYGALTGGNVIGTVPRGQSGTCSAYAFMLAYNQFSSDPATAAMGTVAGADGGRGRNGAQRTIIFETDGVASATATNEANPSAAMSASPLFVPAGVNSIFKVRYDNGETPDAIYGPPTPTTAANNYPVLQTQSMVDLLTSQITNASAPGFATSAKPVLVHCIAFGSLFDPTNSSPAQTEALDMLQYIQWKGGTAPGTNPTAATLLPSYKIVNQSNCFDNPPGSGNGRLSNLQTAFESCLQADISVSLIR